jgi:hypothetical protein
LSPRQWFPRADRYLETKLFADHAQKALAEAKE